MKNHLKKLSFLLQLFDAIWSLPLAFTAFWLVGLLITAMFGLATGTYDMGFIQPLFLAIAVCIGAGNAALGFVFFFARGLFKWFYGKKNADGDLHIPAVDDWQKLTPVHKFLVFALVLFTPMAMVIFVYVKFI